MFPIVPQKNSRHDPVLLFIDIRNNEANRALDEKGHPNGIRTRATSVKGR